jgi:hypothetical protein
MRAMLAGVLAPGRSKGRCQMEHNPCSSKLCVGHGSNDPTMENLTARKPWRDQDKHREVMPKMKKEPVSFEFDTNIQITQGYV